MQFFKNAALQNPDFAKLEKYVNGNNKLPALVTGVSHIHKAHFMAALLNDEPALIVAESEGEAQRLGGGWGAKRLFMLPMPTGRCWMRMRWCC